MVYHFNVSQHQYQESFSHFLTGNIAIITACIVLMWITIASAVTMLQRKKKIKQLLNQLNAHQIYSKSNLDKPYRKLLNIVEEMAIASGVSAPRVYILQKQTCINAFALGNNIHLASLIITQGAVDYLDKNALRALVAHEYSHIFHGDMVLNYRILGLLGGIDSFSQLGKWILIGSSASSKNLNRRVNRTRHHGGGGGALWIMAAGIALYIIGYIGYFLSSIIRALITRQRAYLADASAIQYTRDTKGLCDTLYQVGHKQGSFIYAPTIQNINFMCFANSKNTTLDFEFNTHPTPDKRLNKINPAYLKLVKLKKNKVKQPAKKKKDTSNEHFSSSLAMGMVFALNNKQSQPSISKAQSLIALIPQHIHDNLHQTYLAQGLVLVCLLGDNKNHVKEKLKFISQHLKPRQVENIKQLHSELLPNIKKLRLVLLSLLMPTLQNLNKNKQTTLLRFCKKIILLDNKIDFFEFCVYTLLKKSLLDSDSSFKRTFFQFQPVKQDIIECSYFLLLKENEQNTKVSLLISHLKLPSIKPTKPDFNFNNLYNAIIKLNALTPLLKKRLINNWYKMLFENQQPSQTTKDAFKLMCLCLEVPLNLE